MAAGWLDENGEGVDVHGLNRAILGGEATAEAGRELGLAAGSLDENAEGVDVHARERGTNGGKKAAANNGYNPSRGHGTNGRCEHGTRTGRCRIGEECSTKFLGCTGGH